MFGPHSMNIHWKLVELCLATEAPATLYCFKRRNDFLPDGEIEQLISLKKLKIQQKLIDLSATTH